MQHIGLRLEDENSNIIENSNINFANIIAKLWELNELQKFPWLNGINPYGITLINVTQKPHLLSELNKLKQELKPSDAGLITEVTDFISKIDDHTYIRFIGD